MAQQTLIAEPIRPELVEFRRQDVAIAEMASKYMPLKVNGLEDTDGFKVVHEARMIVKATRVAVEKKRVELKSDALAYGRAVDAEAKRLFALLEPIETHLEFEEDTVINERNRIKREEEERKRAALQARIDKLASVGYVANVPVIGAMSDAEFSAELAEATKLYERRELERLAAEERRRQEEIALAVERERLAEIQRQQDAKAQQLRDEQQRLADLEASRIRAEEIKRIQEQAAEKARIETEQRIAREHAQAIAEAETKALREKAEADAKEAARLKAEAQRPQREKLAAVASAVKSIAVPDGAGSGDVKAILDKAASAILAVANGPLSS